MKVEDFIKNTEKTLQEKGVSFFEAKILAGSRENKIIEVLEDQKVKIRIKSIREKGKANENLLKFLSKKFKSEVLLISGKTNSIKKIKLIKK